VIGNQFAADWPLRVIAEGSARVQPAHKARKEKDMMNCNAPEAQTNRRIPLIAGAALAMACTASLAQLAQAYQLTPPRVPSNIQVPTGNKVFLKGHAVGTQAYICLPSGPGFAWTFFAPQAHLVQRL
jgi:hypothetical protein